MLGIDPWLSMWKGNAVPTALWLWAGHFLLNIELTSFSPLLFPSNGELHTLFCVYTQALNSVSWSLVWIRGSPHCVRRRAGCRDQVQAVGCMCPARRFLSGTSTERLSPSSCLRPAAVRPRAQWVLVMCCPLCIFTSKCGFIVPGVRPMATRATEPHRSCAATVTCYP